MGVFATDALLLVAGLVLAPVSALGQVPSAPAQRVATEHRSVAQQAYLKASNTDAGDEFGHSVAISGRTMVIGAPREDSQATGVDGDPSDDGAANSGAAYVFVRGPLGWSQQAYLKASNTAVNDFFGWSVSLSGDTLVVAAPFEDSSATGVNGDQTNNGVPDSGAAYVFVRDGTSWSQQAYLKASNPGGGYIFGSSVAVSGDTLVIGAEREASNATGVNGNQQNNTEAWSGAAYVFVRSGTIWSQQAYLKASNTQTIDLFGSSVATSGDTVVIGASNEDSSATGVNGDEGDNSALGAGAVYVFVRSGSSWSQEAYLKASNTGGADSFGRSVAVSGDTAVVGALGEDSNATGVDGNQSNNSRNDSGASYVFVRNGTSWSQQAYLKASNTGVFDGFGNSVSISGEELVVGAHFEASNAIGIDGDEDDNSAPFAGAAYRFERDGTGWSQTAYLKATNADAGDRFGESVCVSEGTLVVGALHEASSATGVNGDQADDTAHDSGAAYAFNLHSPAVVFRNAGSNPASYVASPAVIGATFTATVDNDLAGQTSSLLFAFDTPTSFPLAAGQTLLCFDSGSGELFTGGNLFPSASSAGVDSYSLAIPDEPALVDLVVHSQALQLGHPPFVLSNAQDLAIGAF